MVSCLKEIAATIKRPSAIIVVSAHWEESRPTITSGENPALIYDYNGFPEESYEIKYPCPGEPHLARSIIDQLHQIGFDASLDKARGLIMAFLYR
jgi:aromatic ring-opening dioxygenase catalytic subunit (LigB family)